jgi:hypothetical protein
MQRRSTSLCSPQNVRDMLARTRSTTPNFSLSLAKVGIERNTLACSVINSTYMLDPNLEFVQFWNWMDFIHISTNKK